MLYMVLHDGEIKRRGKCALTRYLNTGRPIKEVITVNVEILALH